MEAGTSNYIVIGLFGLVSFPAFLKSYFLRKKMAARIKLETRAAVNR